MSNVVYTFILN